MAPRHASSSSSASDSSSSTDKRKNKTNKKHKRKSERKHKKHKKEKRHKDKTRSKKDSIKTMPIMPAENEVEADISSNDAFGPALPPNLLQKTAKQSIIGPVMPTDYTEYANIISSAPTQKEEKQEDEDEGLADTFGPLPAAATAAMSATQIKLEQRALELKIAAIDGVSSSGIEQTIREEWMLELPAVGLKGGLAALSNMKRTFHQGKERPDFSDRSSWTKTPQTAAEQSEKPGTSKKIAVDLKAAAKARAARERDEEQERMAKKYKKKHKRDESLLELHQQKLRKEQKQKEKELAESGAKPERRPFSRDVDLKLNKIDKNQTKQIVDKAKILNTKFATGHTKYL